MIPIHTRFRNLRLYVSLLLLLLCTSVSVAQTEEEKLVKKAFTDYKSAIEARKFSVAYALLDKNTLQHYRTLLQDVRQADFRRADTLPLYDKFYLLMFRHNTPKATIQTITLQQMVEIVIQQEIINRFETIDAIVVQGDKATAMRVGNGKPTGYRHQFSKETTGWKIGHNGMWEVFNEVWGNLARESKKPENDFLIGEVERITKKKVSADIWKPVVKKK